MPTPHPITLTRAQSRALDHAATQQLAIPTILLMEHAAASLLHRTLKLLHSIPTSIRTPSASSGTDPFPSTTGTTTNDNNTLIILFAGPGNNGGDAYALARLLHLQHKPLLIIPVGPPPKNTSDAAINQAIAQRLNLPFLTFDDQSAETLRTRINAEARPPTSIILIDALLGTGASRPLSPDIASAVNLINQLRQSHPNARTLAIDLPTGLDADTGEPLGTITSNNDSASPTPSTIVRADLTVTLAALKPGLLTDAAKPYIGDLEVGDIGLPHHFIAAFAASQH